MCMKGDTAGRSDLKAILEQRKPEGDGLLLTIWRVCARADLRTGGFFAFQTAPTRALFTSSRCSPSTPAALSRTTNKDR